jgi:glutamine synthetase
LEGIKNKIDPPPVTKGNIYDKKDVKKPPTDIEEALEYFENSKFIENSFGKDVHQHLIKFYKNEIDRHNSYVTEWELGRYFDQI